MNFASNKGAAAAAFAAALGAAALVAPGASAYTGATAVCNGASIIGGGASLQKTAQTNWGADQLNPTGTPAWALGTVKFGQLQTSTVATKGFGFAGAPGAGACTSRRTSGKKVSYASVGSGGGRNSWAADGVATHRDTTANWVSTDEPPSTTEETNIEKVGLKAVTTVETIPVTQAAIAVIANLPTGCSVTSTSRTATLGNLEKEWWGTNTTWGQLLGSTALTPSSCASKVVTRVARADSSGSSFALKKVLNTNNTHWTTPTDYTTPANNTVWPAAVTKPTATGGGAVADLVNATPGSLGYVDLATARSKGFGFSGTTDKTFWLKINAPAAGGSTVTNDPSKDAAPAPATFGANCNPTSGARAYANVPTSTQGNWFNVTGAKATYAAGEYPICTLTYALAYDKYQNFTGTTEPQARSVFDYVSWVVSTAGGQSTLAAGDYQALPTAIQSLSAAGASRINW